MGMRYCVIAILMLLPAISFSQELSSAEKFRSSKEFNNTLVVFKESQLISKSNQHVIYRIIIVPTFYHPISIRIEQNSSDYALVAKSLSGQGGYSWGKLKKEKHRNLSKKNG
jgi:hypothetical protein